MQHRKVYIDDWCLMEKICLVSAVLRLGDSNWSSVSELIKPKLQENRPWDWFTPEACEAQYQVLFNEYVKPQINDESPALQIIQNLKTKCKVECQLKEEQRNKYLTLKKKLENFLKSGVESEVIDKYYEEIQREKKEKEENLRRHQEALKRREILKQEFEAANVPRTPNKQETKTDGSPSPIVTSPLLSSLLNNPPAIQYRPTLSTSSFIPNKTAQSLSKSSSFEKLQTFSSDASFKDKFSSELAEQITSLDRQPVPVASSSSTIIKKLESQEPINTMPIVSGNRTPVSESSASRIVTSSTETTPKSDPQNLENLRLISPNVEEYLTEVDIPPEELLEVIGNLKEGTISLDNLIRDLEATEEGVIIDKDLTTVSIAMNEPYVIDTKPVEQVPYTPEIPSQVQLNDEIKTEFIDESKVEVNEVEVGHSDLPLTEHDKLDTEEQVIIVEDTDRKEHIIQITETEDIANIEMNDVDLSVIKDESPSSLSLSSTVAVSVELDSLFSEQKSDNETVGSQVTKSVSNNKSSESEMEEDTKSKCPSKPVIVIKRIEDGTNHSNKNRKSKSKILEEPVKEAENVPSEVDQSQDEKELQPEEVTVTTTQHEIVEKIQPKPHESETETPVIEENIIIEKDIDSKEEEKMEEATQFLEPVEQFSTADDSDVSDKFEDALQTPIEEVNETEVAENTVVVVEKEPETKSSPYVDLDESFELNVSEEKPTENLSIEEKQEEVEKEAEIPAAEQITQVLTEVENLEQKKIEDVENIPIIERIEENNVTLDESKINEAIQEIVEENKKLEEVKPPPAKIIKSSKRKRKSTSETSDVTSEMSIVIPREALKEIETVDPDIEQTFTPVHSIKTEPSDSKPEDERKEQEEETPAIEKPMPRRESTPARIKSEKRDTKTPEPVVMVLRRSSSKTQSPMKKMDRESRSMDNSELVKTRKKSIMLAYNRLTTHKYANAFQKPITNRQAPGYESIIYKPMDLHTIKKKIDNKQINTVAEFQRDILLMLNNAKMFNRINSQVYNMAVEVEDEVLPNIQLTVQNLGEGVLSKVQKTSEKVRKRPSLDSAKKDVKLIKRIKYSTPKDDSSTNLPIKKPKLEENEDE